MSVPLTGDTIAMISRSVLNGCLGGELSYLFPWRRTVRLRRTGVSFGEPADDLSDMQGASNVLARRHFKVSSSPVRPVEEGYLIDVYESCGGSGRRSVQKPLRIDIPPAAQGAQLRGHGAGEQGRCRGRDGDCVVHVRVQPHPHLRRKGNRCLSSAL